MNGYLIAKIVNHNLFVKTAITHIMFIMAYGKKIIILNKHIIFKI